jgi:nucleoside-diphosphate-sugar epimerase
VEEQQLMHWTVCGAGGFIGGHVVAALRAKGAEVRAVDKKPFDEWWQCFDDVENVVADLREVEACHAACEGANRVLNFAADMGGMGFIESNKAACMINVLIDTHLLMAARDAEVEQYFFASSACVYAAGRQDRDNLPPLRESDAYPAMPEDGYGWEKLYSERMCRHFHEDFGLDVRVARFHNVYGPQGSWQGGREKAPAAICRKVIDAVHRGPKEIEIWGDGSQVRSFLWIGDAVEGVLRLLECEAPEPVNLGSSERVTIKQLVELAESFPGLTLERRYKLDAPRGVNGRSSDNTLLRKYTGGWEPPTLLRTGLAETYRWIEGEYLA